MIMEADMQVLNMALNRAIAAGKTGLLVRTQTIVELGGEGCLAAADRTRYANTADSAKHTQTSAVACKDLKELLSQ